MMTSEEVTILRGEVRRLREAVERIKSPVSNKMFITLSSILFAGLGALATIHAVFIVPALRDETRQIVDTLIEAHEKRPHQHSVTQEQMALIMGQMDRLATKEAVAATKDAINRLQVQIDKIADKLDK